MLRRQVMPDATPQPPGGHEHRFESLAVFATVVRSPALLRVLLAYLLFSIAELATWIAILVYAYDQGGATASGLVAFAQLAPAVVFAPVGSALGDRIPRIRMLALAYAAYAVLVLLAGGALVGDAEPIVVYATVVIAGLALVLVRPAHAAVLPTIARTPSELTAANVASGTVESVGVLLGSVGGGVLLAAVGAGGVFLVSGAALVAGCVAVATMRPATATRRTRVELSLASTEVGAAVPVPGARDEAAAAAVGQVVTRAADPGVAGEILAGLRAIHGDRNLRVTVLVLALSMMLTGVLDVLGVVLALDVLGAGEEAVGLLSGSLGAGGLLGAGLAIGLVGRSRLLGPMLVAAVVTGLGIGVSGVVPLLIVAVTGFLAGGIGKSVFDVAGRTMLQRVAPDATLTRIFGVLEGVSMGALAVGTLVAPVLVQLLGPMGALIVAGVIVPGATLMLHGALRRVDASGVVHEQELGLIRGIPMFAPLRVTALERLAQELDHLHAPAGADIVRQGDSGDRFYLIATGTCAVLIDGRAVKTLGPGEGFGEIALLNDIPRTATVRSVTDVDLFVLDRAPFLEAVTGLPRSRQLAQERVEALLAENRGTA